MAAPAKKTYTVYVQSLVDGVRSFKHGLQGVAVSRRKFIKENKEYIDTLRVKPGRQYSVLLVP